MVSPREHLEALTGARMKMATYKPFHRLRVWLYRRRMARLMGWRTGWQMCRGR